MKSHCARGIARQRPARHVSDQMTLSLSLLCADSDVPQDVEVGQTSELVALAENASSLHEPPIAGNRWQAGSAKLASQQHIDQLKALCATIRVDGGISENVKKVCAALEDNLSSSAAVA